jgi:hypothetical protein
MLACLNRDHTKYNAGYLETVTRNNIKIVPGVYAFSAPEQVTTVVIAAVLGLPFNLPMSITDITHHKSKVPTP